jgi:hypothetical protein
MMMRVQTIYALPLIAVMAIAGVSCKEALPVYQDPRELFDASFSGFYRLTPGENNVRVYMTIINRFDETLEARGVLNGPLVISWGDDPTLKKTMTWSRANIIYASGYDTSGTLRFDPGDSIRIGTFWDFIADDGRSLRESVQMVHDPDCPIRRISARPVPLIFEGGFVLYDRTGAINPKPLRFEFTLVYQFVDPGDC